MSIDVNVQNDLVIVTESSEDITVNVSNAAGANGVGVPTGGTTGQVLKKLSNTNYDTYWALDGGGVPYSGATGQVDLGNYDLKVQGLTIGKGNNALVNNTALGHSTLLAATTGNFNTAVGYESLRNTTTGQYNTAVGQSSLFSNTTGGQNTALGLNALLLNTTGSTNVAVGLDTLQHITTGSSNTAIGYNAGSHITGGSTPNTTATNSVFIGRDSKANADGQTNQIVIGQNAVGNGSNTATFGNTATTANYFTGSINGGSFVKSGGTSSQFLKADGSVDSSTYVGGSGATGQVAYWNGTSSQTGSNNLFWDAANARLGIGTNAPSTTLDIRGKTRIQSSGAAELDIIDGSNSLRLAMGSTQGFVGTLSSHPFGFFTGALKRGEFSTNGNFILQNGGTFTDAGFRLDVNGTARVSGAVNLATSTGNVGIGVTGGVLKLDVQGNAADTTTVGGVTVEQVTLFRPSNGVGGIRSGFNTTTGHAYIWSSTSGGNLNFGTRSAPDNNVGMTLTYGGNLLVGTTIDFGQRFQVSGAGKFSSSVTASILYADDGTTIIRAIPTSGIGYFGTQTNSPLVFQTNSDEKMRITSAGNLLVGTTTDNGEKLQINGTSRFSSTLQITGNGTKINWFNSGFENWFAGTILNSTSFSISSATTSNILTLFTNGAATFSSSVTATQFRLSALNTAPANASATGTLGEIRIDADYIYVCTATNTWKRTAIATW
jgi:hypothetical protein